jgi:hypothetical protein
VVALRAQGGHPWSEEVPRGRPVFGLSAEVLLAAGEGELELDPAGLEARLVEPPPVAAVGPRRPATAPVRVTPVLEPDPGAAPRRGRRWPVLAVGVSF